ncbi:hypothetical protein KC19_8G069800 [Ceratodon purpureus]|uniref:Uncharacterized protein n=1 Tax=Ceratodon purpureus TaxID=3225 RepID=A0A8T0H490_CERPU|nr:hypothetical protein KC19_8G069800 [Ceratodon purpureus]
MNDYHINIELCASIQVVKYIHKYIYKGHVRATSMKIDEEQDEIKQYLDARYIKVSKVERRLFKKKMHKEDPNVVWLYLHLLRMHCMIFNTSNDP